MTMTMTMTSISRKIPNKNKEKSEDVVGEFILLARMLNDDPKREQTCRKYIVSTL